jgi:peptidoglycan/LPS O-acetylase OafA/YrhL
MRHPDTFGRFSAGDALRGLSALGVLALHATGISMIESGPPGIGGFEAMRSTYGPVGWLALVGGQWLYVFFVLSGYLISRPFVIAYIQARPLPDVARYARNRILRIVPAFWVAVLATLLVFGLMGSSPWAVVLTLLFSQAFAAEELFTGHIGQGWTMGTEVTFYALVPILALWWSRRPRRRTPTARAGQVLAIAALLFVATPVWRLLVPDDNPTWFLVFPAVAGAFAPGIALAAVEATWPRRISAPGFRRLALPVALSGLALFFLVASTDEQLGIWRTLAGFTGAGLIVTGALMREWSGAPAWKLLRNRATEWLGQRSYSIYVLHYGVIVWLSDQLAVRGHPWDTIARIGPLGLVLSLALATLSWRFVEQPFLRLRRRWATPAVVGRPQPSESS